MLDQMGLLDNKEHQGTKETKVKVVCVGHQEFLDFQDLQVELEQKEDLEDKDAMDVLVLQERKELQGQ